MAIKMATAGVDAEATALSAVLNAGTLKLWDGTQPATADTTSGASVLGVTLLLANPAFGASVAGVITANAIPSATSVATITATWGRFYTAGGTSVMDADVATSGASITLTGTTVIQAGALVSLTSVVHTVTK